MHYFLLLITFKVVQNASLNIISVDIKDNCKEVKMVPWLREMYSLYKEAGEGIIISNRQNLMTFI